MVTMIEYLAMGIIALTLGAVGAYVALKYTLKPEVILGFSDAILDEITENQEYQKKIYVLGAILGNGIKSGIGITGKGGKFKFQDLIGMVLSKWLGGTTGQTSEQPSANSQDNLLEGLFKQQP